MTRRPRRCLYIIGWDILSSSSEVPLFLDGKRMWDEGRGRSLSLASHELTCLSSAFPLQTTSLGGERKEVTAQKTGLWQLPSFPPM